MRRSFIAVAVALPLVALGIGIVRSERHLAEGRRWSFEVTGYDPRDLLRGHYIQYRLVLEEVDLPVAGAADGIPCDDATSGECCLCLYADYPQGPTTVERADCASALSVCDGTLQTRYLDELQRYYIAEDRAAELTQIFQDASQEKKARLIVAIDETGRPQIDVLLVNEMPVEQARRAPKPGADAPAGDGAAPDADTVAPDAGGGDTD